MALPFLQAMRRSEYPSSVCVEREFTITYTMSGCQCGNCHQQKTVRALSRADARRIFENKYPIPTVISVN